MWFHLQLFVIKLVSFENILCFRFLVVLMMFKDFVVK